MTKPSSTSWQQIEIILSNIEANALSDWLEGAALSISLIDAGNQPLFQQEPFHTPLWENITIQVLFDESENLSEILKELKIRFSTIQSIQIKHIENQDWVRLTQSQFAAQLFADRLWIIPSWDLTPQDGLKIVKIDPGLAFGTGNHPTTGLCLEWLAKQDLRDKKVMDFGCGSGILTLAALALGAKEAWAVDHDPQALEATNNNAKLNNFIQNNLHIIDSGALPEIKFDLIVANILANPLCELEPLFFQKLAAQGLLVLSGILNEEKAKILKVYQTHFDLIDEHQKEDWIALILRKKS